jgi:uncharacterized protein with gpF-like domain
MTRTHAQKEADKRYYEKNRKKQKVISFIYKEEEAREIEKIIDDSGMTKADFLRNAVKNFNKS